MQWQPSCAVWCVAFCDVHEGPYTAGMQLKALFGLSPKISVTDLLFAVECVSIALHQETSNTYCQHHVRALLPPTIPFLHAAMGFQPVVHHIKDQSCTGFELARYKDCALTLGEPHSCDCKRCKLSLLAGLPFLWFSLSHQAIRTAVQDGTPIFTLHLGEPT